MRVLKWIGLLLVSVLVLLVAALLVLRFVIDPNDFKGEISSLVKQASGYELTLQGDLSWSFYPVLGFQSESVTLAAAADQPPLLTLRSLALGVQLIPLFDRQLKVEQLQLEGLNAQLQVDAKGRANWELPALEDSAAVAANTTSPVSADANSSGSDTAAPLPELLIPLIRIVDSSIRYRDAGSGTDVGVTIDSLELRNVQLKDPIQIQLKGSVAQVNGPTVQLQLTSELLPDLDQQRYQLAPFALESRVEGVLTAPLAVTLLSSIVVDLSQEQATIKLDKLAVADAQWRGELAVQKFSTEPVYQGTLTSSTLDIPALLAMLEVTPPRTAGSNVLKTAVLALSFNGGTSQVRIPSLTLQLDESKLTGSVAVTSFERQALTFDLLLDHINLDDYLPPVEEGGAEAGNSPAASTKPASGAEQAVGELLPVELLRTLDLEGTLRLTKVHVQQEDINNIVLAVRARNGLVDISRLQAALLGGSVDGHVSIDAKASQPKLTTVLKVSNVELTSVSSRFMEDALLSGKASFDLDTTATGNTTDDLLRSALGQMNLQLNNGVLHGVNLNSIVVDALHAQLGNFESVFPQYQQYMPRQLRKDTDISKLLAHARLENGQLIMPDFEFFTDESGIAASGKVDLVGMGFAYDFGVVLSAVERNKYLKGTQWPVRCEGALAGSPADWCRPDSKKMGVILRKAASNALKDKTAAELGEKVGLDAADQQQVEAELKQKAKEEEDRAKRKVQQKLDKWLNKL